MTSKGNVRFALWTPDLVWMLEACLHAERHEDAPEVGLVVTSGSDGTHRPDSKHYRGQALDLRSHTFRSGAAKRRFMKHLSAVLGPRYAVLLEHEGGGHEHFHLQVKKGLA